MLGNGKELGIEHLEYGYQKGEGGIADALRTAEDFAEKQPIMVVLGDNFTDADLRPAVESFTEGARLLRQPVRGQPGGGGGPTA